MFSMTFPGISGCQQPPLGASRPGGPEGTLALHLLQLGLAPGGRRSHAQLRRRGVLRGRRRGSPRRLGQAQARAVGGEDV